MADEKDLMQTPEDEAPKAESPARKEKEQSQNTKPGKLKSFGNFFVRMGRRIKKFCSDFVNEKNRVTWMSGKDVRKSTILVCVMVVAAGIVIGVVDTVFYEIISGIAGLIG